MFLSQMQMFIPFLKASSNFALAKQQVITILFTKFQYISQFGVAILHIQLSRVKMSLSIFKKLKHVFHLNCIWYRNVAVYFCYFGYLMSSTEKKMLYSTLRYGEVKNRLKL
jgi:hypothetical protein